jgi:hypothetical protein
VRLTVRSFIAVVTCCLLSSCTFLSNRDYVKQYAAFKGIKRIAVFLQRWPVYRQQPKLSGSGDEFIRPQTQFYGPWQPASQMDPRALDIKDIDAGLMSHILVRALESKGYQVFLVDVLPGGSEGQTVETLMANYQAINPPVDAFLFCYYAPTLYVSQALPAPGGQERRSVSLLEVIQRLGPGSDAVIWVGHRSDKSPAHSMSHAFIYLSLTMFRALDGQTLMAVADSQATGKVRPWIPRCPPGPTDRDYPADPAVIQNLMVNNLQCRLRHLLPDAF